MMGFLSRPSSAVWVGLAISAGVLALWLARNGGDLLGFVSFAIRFAHIAAAILWIGMIWFVNFIQLAALGSAEDAVRAALLRHIALPVAMLFRVASHVVVLSGAGLLLTTGYMLDRWVFPSAVYIPSLRAALIWCGALAALIMWALVHFVVWPNLKVLVEGNSGAATLARAREKVLLAARVNLLLAVPVTFAMVAASHLY
jgi:uncharacterized membrane protein